MCFVNIFINGKGAYTKYTVQSALLVDLAVLGAYTKYTVQSALLVDLVALHQGQAFALMIE